MFGFIIWPLLALLVVLVLMKSSDKFDAWMKSVYMWLAGIAAVIAAWIAENGWGF